MDQDELITALYNSVETLTKRLDSLEESNAKNIEAMNALNETVTRSNEVFDEASDGVKKLYEKVKQLEVWSKLLPGILSNLSTLGPLLGPLLSGGLGGQGSQKKT